MPLYYINNARFKNMKRRSENFYENFLYHVKGAEKEMTLFLSQPL